METPTQTFTSSENMAVQMTAPIVSVTGHYQLFEYQKTGTEKNLVALPITVRIQQQPDFIALELQNESEGTTTQLKYPMNGAANWDEALQAFTFTRTVGNAYVADIITPLKNTDRNSLVTNRITWNIDEKGQILESYDYFNANGSRLDSSPGHLRTLVPILEN